MDLSTAPTGSGFQTSDGLAPRVAPSWFQLHPRMVDLLVVLAVFLYNLPIQFGAVPARLWPGTALVVSLGLCLPALVRRQRPLAVFVVTAGVAVLQVLLGVGLLPADVMLLVAVYTVAVRLRWLVSALVTVSVAGWTVIATQKAVASGDLNFGDVGVLVAVTVWAWTWGRLVQVRRNYIASLRERAEQAEREKAAEARAAASAERTRIARELHDIVSHSLSVSAVLSDGAAATVGTDPEQAGAAMVTVRDLSRTALADMRRMLGVLRDDEPGSHAPLPGVAQLPELVEQSRTVGMPVRLSVDTGGLKIPASVDLTAYRVVQEALTNVRKHAGVVTEVQVTVRRVDDAVEVRVVDDGAGHGGTAARMPGHGLVGMRERVATHHGHLQAGARQPGGFEVVATIPIEEES